MHENAAVRVASYIDRDPRTLAAFELAGRDARRVVQKLQMHRTEFLRDVLTMAAEFAAHRRFVRGRPVVYAQWSWHAHLWSIGNDIQVTIYSQHGERNDDIVFEASVRNLDDVDVEFATPSWQRAYASFRTNPTGSKKNMRRTS